ncbi:uncharacterized protein LOC105280127 isoform X2 [Ooceraea biroi]|uniref:uncharacterized protein LOC105280127 isoform X2 n=1 Tax=Ooceraea biroi TaxID=2015173 RepID=UPI000F07E0D4|nr:uncharacterized protein LOC105280127 isoform X2 [Ooceraea biroi]
MSRRGRKRKEEDEEQKVAEGEQDNLSSDEMKEEIEMMWEIPQIFQFLHLTRESLNVPQFSIYEMERMLLIPRASKQLANIMTCLLSSPITKAKLRKVPPMPYEFWTNILAHKMASWFKVYHAKHKDAAKVLETIGIEPEFWCIFPDAALLDGKDFENLSFKQRVWLLKTVCDTIMHTRKTVQEDIAKQPWEDQFETVLGTDRYGARYIYFPQFVPNDLRIYRHCLDNKILSTVKPARSTKQGVETSKLIGARLNRYKLRKLQSHSSMSDRKLSRRENKTSERDDKDVNSCKSGNSASSSFTSEDMNLSSSSTCSNNNNISLDISKERQRISSKASERNALPNNRHIDDRSTDDESLQMFKGFPDIKDNNYSIGIINEMLDNLKSEIDKEQKTRACRSSGSGNESESQENLVVASCRNTIDFCGEVSLVERESESERSSDNLSSSSKTDDEKLNEIISAEYSKLPESTYSRWASVNDNVSDNSSTSTSKSDDEKLSETKIVGGSVDGNGASSARRVTLNGSLRACSDDSASLSEGTIKCERFDRVDVPVRATRTRSNDSRMRAKLRSRYREMQCDEIEVVKAEKLEDKKDLATGNAQLQEALDAVSDYVNGCDADYDLRRPKGLKTAECKQRFNKMLTDLSISDFRLVADSVEGLRDLIASFSLNESESNNAIKAELVPPCEFKLVTKLTELLSSLEEKEATLKDATRKAKAKLQREWSNFKEGVEDQDSSGESGLSSNWWVLGSQGRDPLSTAGDATLQTLPQFALSSPGAQSTQQQSQPVEGEHKSAADESAEQSCRESRKCASDERQSGNDEKQSDAEDAPSKRDQVKEREESREREQRGQNENASDNKDAAQQTRRVLRARGVSSYTEQFYSDDESDENELEGWTDIEAVYAAPGTQTDTSAAHAAPKDRHADDRSEQEEDSDQDWILPSSRKRKNKRSSANRRLKSFQHKVQSITENTSESSALSDNALQSANMNKHKAKLKSNSEIREFRMPTANSARQSSDKPRHESVSDEICKIESVNSVHSELNIEDDVIYESTTTHYQQPNSYGPPSTQQDYYYVVSQNPGIAQAVIPQGAPIVQQAGAIVQQIATPQLQQGYYVPIAQPNYVIQTPSFLPVAQQQQPVYSQNPQLIATTQPYINNAGYVPHVITTTQPQTEYVVASGQIPRPQNPVLCTPRPMNRYSQNNRRSVRGRMPARGGSQRPANPASVRGHAPQQYAPNSKTATRQRTPQAVGTEQASQTSRTENSSQKTTSLIMLSDSDDEIEMIITEKATANTSTDKRTASERAISAPQRNIAPKQKPTVTSDIAIDSTKGIISPQIIQRMSQGGISITPIKSNPSPSASNSNTQLVVVVNETGSHYALALPNGSKLILTPEQVAQIRASNGGKLIL